jgi:hypothetical protein
VKDKKGIRQSGGITSHVLSLGVIWRSVVTFSHQAIDIKGRKSAEDKSLAKCTGKKKIFFFLPRFNYLK